MGKKRHADRWRRNFGLDPLEAIKLLVETRCLLETEDNEIKRLSAINDDCDANFAVFRRRSELTAKIDSLTRTAKWIEDRLQGNVDAMLSARIDPEVSLLWVELQKARNAIELAKATLKAAPQLDPKLLERKHCEVFEAFIEELPAEKRDECKRRLKEPGPPNVRRSQRLCHELLCAWDPSKRDEPFPPPPSPPQPPKTHEEVGLELIEAMEDIAPGLTVAVLEAIDRAGTN